MVQPVREGTFAKIVRKDHALRGYTGRLFDKMTNLRGKVIFSMYARSPKIMGDGMFDVQVIKVRMEDVKRVSQ